MEHKTEHKTPRQLVKDLYRIQSRLDTYRSNQEKWVKLYPQLAFNTYKPPFTEADEGERDQVLTEIAVLKDR